MLLVTLISSISHSQSEPNEALSRRRPVFTPSTSVDTPVWLSSPGLAAVLTEPNEPPVNQEALFATHSFSNRGTTYNVEFYYREFYHRLRARVFVEDRELWGLFNRFYDVDPNHRYMVSVHARDEGKPEVGFNFGFLSLKESFLDTDAIYDAVETFAGKALPGTQIPWIRVYPPPGMLKKTCSVLVEHFHLLVNEKGQIGPFTLENLLIAYCQEEIKAEEREDFERIGRSLVKTHGESMGLINTVIADVNEVGRYGPRLLDPVNAAEIRPPSFHRDGDSQTDYWTCYARARYKMGPAILTRYKFGFQNGLLHSGERAVLAEDASGAYTGYPNLKNVRNQEEIILDQSNKFEDSDADSGPAAARSPRTQEQIIVRSSKNFVLGRAYSELRKTRVATLRIVLVSAGVSLIILAFVVRTYVRCRSKVSICAPGADAPVCGTQKEKTANENR